MDTIEQQPLPVLPKIEYAKEIQDPECPYNIDINPQGCRKLLLTAGVSEDKIGSLTVKVKRKSPFPILGTTLGQYNVEDNVIELFTDPLWRNTEKARRRAGTILSHRLADSTQTSKVVTPEFEVGSLRVAIVKDPNKNLFPELSSEKRLSWYFSVAPIGRARRTADKLIGRRMAKDLQGTFAHEAQHATISKDEETQAKRGLLVQMIYFSVIGNLLMTSAVEVETRLIRGVPYPDTPQGTAYLLAAGLVGSAVALALGREIRYSFLDPVEKSARKFEKEFKDIRMQRFITFSPK